LAADSRFCRSCGARVARRRRNPAPRRRRLGLAGAGVLLVAVLLVPGILYVSAGLPDAGQLSAAGLPQATRVYDRSGTLLGEIRQGSERRRFITLPEVAPVMVQATVAVEDRSFYQHHGLNWARLLKAAWIDLTHGRREQGGSTITQQLVKNLLLTREQAPAPRTLGQKVRESLLAVQVEQKYSKDQILEAYLNRVYYGAQAYGVEAAATTYFGRSAKDLTLSQAALLAGLPAAPSQLDPYINGAGALQRQQTVLDAMVRAGFITRVQAAAARQEARTLALVPRAQGDTVRAPHFVRWIAAQLETSYGPDLWREGGLSVTTSLDWGLQEQAERLVAEQVQAAAPLNVTTGALVAIKPSTGEVLALVGSAGRDAPGGEYNMALQPRQPGSAFKIFTYSAALDSRTYTMASTILDAPLTLPTGGDPNGRGPYSVRNYDGRYRGCVTLPQALGSSLNVPAVRVETSPGVGVPRVVETARRMGVDALSQPTDQYGPSLTLGGYEIPLLQLTSGAATLAAQGTYHRPQGILQVKDARGKLLSTFRPAARPALSPQVAFIMSEILAEDGHRRLAFPSHSALEVPGHRVAAKTGTTNDHRDNLTVGYTPDLATGVWVGNANNSPMTARATGLTGAAPLWHAFVAHALQAFPDRWFAVPAGVVRRPGPAGPTYLLAGTEGVQTHCVAPGTREKDEEKDGGEDDD